jgi:hypothetical protein
MSPFPVVVSSAPQAKTCPFGANCSCVFSRNLTIDAIPTDPAMHSEALTDAVTAWIDLGWRVTSADSTQVVLQRQKGLAFCLNVLLVPVTGFLWLIYWIPRLRHPKIETKTITVTATGAIEEK